MASSGVLMKRDYLAELKRTVLAMFVGQPAKVFLFGSRARGTHFPRSDVDIGILLSDPSASTRITLLREQIENLNIPYKVDVVNFAEVSPAFRENAIRSAEVWQE